MKVELITKSVGITGSLFENRSIDEIIVGQARVSTSRSDQELFDTPEKLIRHCILNQHWSIFELANLGFKVETSRAIGREILRHGTHIGLTEFSQRYSEVLEMEPVELRKQAQSNRQSSTEVFDPLIPDNSSMVYDHINKKYIISLDAKESAEYQIERESNRTIMMYNDMLEAGVARESARMILPETTKTTIYLNARIREIITFLNARLHKTAQKEIQEIAELIRDIFIEQCPIIANALFNFEKAYDHHIIDQLVLEKYKVRQQILFPNE